MKLILNEWRKYLSKSTYTIVMPLILLFVYIFYYGGIYLAVSKSDTTITPEESDKIFIWGMTICYYYSNYIAILMASNTLSTEISSGTIKFILTRPYQRYKILLAKIGSIILFMPVLQILSAIGVLLLQLLATAHLPEFNAILKTVVLFIALSLVVTIFYSSLALLLSTFTSSTAFITAFCFIYYFFADSLWKIINLRYFDLSPDSLIYKLSPLNANNYLIELIKNTYFQSLDVDKDLYITFTANIVYTCILFLIAVMIFRRRDISLAN